MTSIAFVMVDVDIVAFRASDIRWSLGRVEVDLRSSSSPTSPVSVEEVG